jgi:hypothetical protein
MEGPEYLAWIEKDEEHEHVALNGCDDEPADVRVRLGDA